MIVRRIGGRRVRPVSIRTRRQCERAARGGRPSNEARTTPSGDNLSAEQWPRGRVTRMISRRRLLARQMENRIKNASLLPRGQRRDNRAADSLRRQFTAKRAVATRPALDRRLLISSACYQYGGHRFG